MKKNMKVILPDAHILTYLLSLLKRHLSLTVVHKTCLYSQFHKVACSTNKITKQSTGFEMRTIYVKSHNNNIW